MKKLILFIAMFLFVCAGACAQGFLKKIGKNVKDKTTDSVEEKADQTVDIATDKVFDAVNNLLLGKKNKKKKGEEEDEDDDETDEEGNSKPKVSAAWTCPNPECGHTGNTGKFCEECGTKRPMGMSSAFEADGRYITDKIMFNPGSSELKFESVKELQKIAGFMNSDSKIRLIVQVFSINPAGDNSEDAISDDRAEAVVKALIGMGCDEFNLRAADKNYGKDSEDYKPLPANLKGTYVVFTKK